MTRPIVRAWIRPSAVRSILDAYAAAGGREPCGLLLGRTTAGTARIREAPQARNAHPRPGSNFLVAPEDHARIQREARADDAEVVGYWHGHLAGPAAPGHGDREGLAAAEGVEGRLPLLVIVGRGAGVAPVVRAWSRRACGLREVPLASARAERLGA